MASAPSMSVSVECVNICKFSIGDGSGRYDCSVLSCAWKAPRALTGFLASTAQPTQSSTSFYGRTWRRNRLKCRCETSHMVSWYSTEASEFILPGRLLKSSLLQIGCRKWRLCSFSTSLASYDEVSPDRLWEWFATSLVASPALVASLACDLVGRIFWSSFSLCVRDWFSSVRGSRLVILVRDFISWIASGFRFSPCSRLPLIDLLPSGSRLVFGSLDVRDCISSSRLVFVFGLLAFEAHDGQKRRSGEPFIVHLVEVARILGELELDWESIATGLLHDTVEDIEKEFGPIVSKLRKLKCKNENHSVQDVKADDLRQMFLVMTEEVCVIIVKLADRLHNMRTLSHMPPHKQASIAMETLQVFAPLAKLLGMYQIKVFPTAYVDNLTPIYLGISTNILYFCAS
ncbi:GTP diphosphokinase [Sarracenia purpurea var. burkii]